MVAEEKVGELVLLRRDPGAGTLKPINPRCMGDSLLRSDCDSTYSQGVRMYIVSKYQGQEGFNVKDSVDISAEMTSAKFCLAGPYTIYFFSSSSSRLSQFVPDPTEFVPLHTSKMLELSRS